MDDEIQEYLQTRINMNLAESLRTKSLDDIHHQLYFHILATNRK